MTRKSIITSAQETIFAAGKSAAKRAKALAGEVANAASAATATAVPAVREKAASAQETVVAAGKTAAEGTKTLVGELAHAAAYDGYGCARCGLEQGSHSDRGKETQFPREKRSLKNGFQEARYTKKESQHKESVPQV